MDLTKAQVLITGGSDGIGKALAERFLKAGSRVIITGRDGEKLKKAVADLPGLEYLESDISRPADREELADFVKQKMPGINVLINNAGIQRRIGLAEDNAPWSESQAEIDTLLAGPIHLNNLLIPLLIEKESIVVNVTSGGAYIPQVFAPVYSSCKAALHHYTMILRHALANTPCRVVELIPPAVQTSFAGDGHQHGASLNEFADYVFTLLTTSAAENIGFGATENLQLTVSGKPLEALFEASAGRFPVKVY